MCHNLILVVENDLRRTELKEKLQLGHITMWNTLQQYLTAAIYARLHILVLGYILDEV